MFIWKGLAVLSRTTLLRLLVAIIVVLLVPLSAAAQHINPVLQRGSDQERAESVRVLQELLNRRLSPSPNLKVDGVFGPATEAAVRRVQRESGREADGVVGGRTWAALLELSVNRNVVVSIDALLTLRAVLDRAGLASATVTSGVRTPADQARVMYDNIRQYGVDSQKKLYGPNGDQVIDVYVAHAKEPRDRVIALMRAKILELGPSRVSKHCSDTHDVIDVAPSSIADRKRFEEALHWAKDQGEISHVILPPSDPAYHIEKPRKSTSRSDSMEARQ